MTKFEPLNPDNYYLPEVLELIESDFYKHYKCPSCFTGAINNKYQFNEVNPNLKIEYRGCNCNSLKVFNASNQCRRAITFQVTESIYWVAYWAYGLPTDNKLIFKVIENPTNENPDLLIISKPAFEYRHFPTFVFKTLKQMTRILETMITFQ